MRIIGGEFRGRRLATPAGQGTRPTPDRVREALFQVLADWLPDARVLELFGGTGSLGLESLSRGAAAAVFCEKARGALACLEKNVAALGVADRTVIHPRSAFDLPKFLHDDPGFDLVFCDPPFRMIEEADARRRIENLLAAVPLADDGLVILEHRAGHLADLSPTGLEHVQTRRWGSTGMAIYRSDSPPSRLNADSP